MAKFTKQAIYTSFLKFLDEKPLDRITVKDIVEDCGINRKTFYYYFQDIYALTDELFKEKLAALKANLYPHKDEWEASIMATAKFISENKKLSLHIYRSVGGDKLEDRLYDTGYSHMLDSLMSRAEGTGASEADVRLLTEFFTSAVSAIIVRWLKNGLTSDPCDEMSKLSKLIKGVPGLLLANSEQLNKS